MNTTTVNPEAPATGNFEPHSRTGPRYQAEPERTALRRPIHDRMLTGVAADMQIAERDEDAVPARDVRFDHGRERGTLRRIHPQPKISVVVHRFRPRSARPTQPSGGRSPCHPAACTICASVTN